MADLIDRQAVLKYIEKIRQGAQMMDDIRRASIIMLGMNLGEEAVRNQPSAQTEIIRCKDCKYQRKGQNECEAWNLCGYRPWQYTPITDGHFCSYAEREEDA